MNKCDYFGCDKPLAPDQAETGMKFCIEHDAEFSAIAMAEPFDPAALLRFWVRARGGAKRMAKSIYGDDPEEEV
jgi:hypothetical protein